MPTSRWCRQLNSVPICRRTCRRLCFAVWRKIPTGVFPMPAAWSKPWPAAPLPISGPRSKPSYGGVNTHCQCLAKSSCSRICLHKLLCERCRLHSCIKGRYFPMCKFPLYRSMSLAWLSILMIGLAVAQTPMPIVQSEAGKKALARIRQLGGLVLELAQNDPRLEVSYLQTEGQITDEHLALLKDLKGLVHLELRGQPVTDAQLAYLKPLTELTHLHLENTKITDKGLENLKGLVHLEYLNLYGTAVSDAGLVNLEGMKKLKRLYLWQTRVTEAGAAKHKKAIPGVDINLGNKEEPQPTVVAKKTNPKKEEKKTEPT